MRTAGSALRQMLDEFRLLLGETFRVLGKLAAPVFGLLLIGWSAYTLAGLAASAWACARPWAVLPVMAVCVVVQLACILAVLRLTAVTLGMPQLLARTALHTEVRDDRDTSPAHLMAVTLLPFLGMYAGFGYLSDFTRSAVLLSSYRCGMPALLAAFSPRLDDDTSTVGLNVWLLVAILLALHLLKRLFEQLRERAKRPLVPAFAQISVETLMAFLMLLGGFRLWQEFDLWWTRTVASLRWNFMVGSVEDAVPDPVLEGWRAVVSFIGETIWPLAVSDALRPFLWLAMAGLVFGTRALALTDFWLLGGRSRRPSRRSKWVAKLQEDSETSRGLRLVGTKAAEFALGGVESKLLPAWQSLRLVLSAGWPFLGAFAITFALLDKARELPHLAMVVILGGHSGDFWIRMWPVESLISDVFILGTIWVMLAVAYTRGLSIIAQKVEQSEVAPVLVAGPTIGAALKQSRWQAVTVITVAAALVVALSAVPATLEADYKDGVVAQVVNVDEVKMKLGEPRLAKQLGSGSSAETTNLVFLIIPVVISNPGPHGRSFNLTIETPERTYLPAHGSLAVGASSGFKMGTEVVFEVQPADVGPQLELLARRAEMVSEYQQVARFKLGLEPNTAVLPETVVANSVWAAA